MTKIETEEQYKWAVERVERLLPMVDDDTPIDNPNLIELNLLSNLVADYSDEHYSVGEPSLADILRLRMEEMRLTPQSHFLINRNKYFKTRRVYGWCSRADIPRGKVYLSKTEY